MILLTLISAWAKDYKSNWKDIDDNSKYMYYRGLISGISWRNTINEIELKGIKEKDSRQRLILYVTSNINRIDPQSVTRIISELYNDSTNAQLHPDIIFFPAAAKLLGYPENEISEVLRILRSIPP